MRWFTLTLLMLAGCGAPQTPMASTASSPGVGIAIEVLQDTTLAGGFSADLSAELRQTLLESKAGVPITAVDRADLVLRVSVLRVNFSNATSWEWQLIDVDSQAVVASGTDTAAMGRNAGPLAREIVGAVAALDLGPFVTSDTAVAAAAAKISTPSDPGSRTDGSNAWAVIIGIENYRDDLPVVTGGEADARAFAAYAKNTLNVPDSNIKVLLGDRASRADVTGALTEWLPRNAVEPGGRVYVFFAGHGAPAIEDGSAYLLPYDANPTYIKSSGLAVKALQDELAALKNQHVFVFLDACFSGRGERSVLPKGTRPLMPVGEVGAIGGVVVFAAASSNQTTGAAPGGTQGLFSYHLLIGLRGAADANGDGDLTIGELHQYVAGTVAHDARRQNREQIPTVAAPEGASKRVLVTGL